MKLSQLSLNPENPRFDPVKDESAALEELCDREQMVEIGEDIVTNGLNPLELIGVVAAPGRKAKGGQTYIVHEGNRRIGAMKMVADFRLAPKKYQAGFKKLDASALPEDIEAIEFSSKADLDHWIKLLHQRDSNPAGRNSWKPDQQVRAFGQTRNKRVVDLLDYAEQQGWISRKARNGKVSTLQRFVSNPSFRQHAGFHYADGTDDLVVDDQTVFDRELKALIDDMLAGKVNTRYDKAAIGRWITGRKAALATSSGSGSSKTTGGAGPASPGSGTGGGTGAGGTGGGGTKSPPPPKKAQNLRYDQDIASELETLGSQKLISFYHSICDVSLQHTPLLVVGCWSFLETLGANVQGTPDKCFKDVFSANYLDKSLGFSDKSRRKELLGAIGRLHDNGNLTKHAPSGAWMDGQQLYNDMVTIRPVIVRVLQVLNGSHASGTPWP